MPKIPCLDRDSDLYSGPYTEVLPVLVKDLYVDTVAATHEITDPQARFNRLVELAAYTRSLDLISEAFDLARSFDTPEERSAALFRVLRAAHR